MPLRFCTVASAGFVPVLGADAVFFFFVGRTSPATKTSAGRLTLEGQFKINVGIKGFYTYFRMCLIWMECMSTLYDSQPWQLDLKLAIGSEMSREFEPEYCVSHWRTRRIAGLTWLKVDAKIEGG